MEKNEIEARRGKEEEEEEKKRHSKKKGEIGTDAAWREWSKARDGKRHGGGGETGKLIVKYEIVLQRGRY